METFRTLIEGHLPPAGEPVVTKPRIEEAFPSGFERYSVQLVDSGTSALALALTNIKKSKPNIAQPEVIVPGYCCPDLVAAAVFAGFTPVVVDIAPEDPSYDSSKLEGAITPNTLAVIAVNFLGLSERFDLLHKSLRAHPQVALIADNAQWFPDTNEVADLQGDYVVFSFGRGKPVSLLGGGMLLSSHDLAYENSAPEADPASNSAVTRSKFRLYNWLLKPQLYQLLSRNPFIRLGETRYHPLEKIQAIDDYRLRLLEANIESYLNKSRATEEFYDRRLDEFNQLKSLYSARRRRLLRYPLVLSSREERDEALSRLNTEGLGATAMYQLPLVELSGLSTMVKGNRNTPNAAHFAERLLTLPVHSGVKTKHLEKIERIFEELGQAR